MQLTKRTPCVGICSTTYGDLVCRGCKRFAHEIVEWNAYDEDQKTLIRDRLQRLQDEVVSQSLDVLERSRLQQAVADAALAGLPQWEGIYQLLRDMVRRERTLASVGLRARGASLDPQGPGQAVGAPADALDTLVLLQAVDKELYARSRAHYERNFKVLT